MISDQNLVAHFSVITVENIAPTCQLTVNPAIGSIPFTVTFAMNASDLDGSIATWTLDIDNDGTVDYMGSGNPPSTQQHTYTTVGTYIATLTVTDNQSNTASDTTVITVTQSSLENQSPIPILLIQLMGILSHSLTHPQIPMGILSLGIGILVTRLIQQNQIPPMNMKKRETIL